MATMERKNYLAFNLGTDPDSKVSGHVTGPLWLTGNERAREQERKRGRE